MGLNFRERDIQILRRKIREIDAQRRLLRLINERKEKIKDKIKKLCGEDWELYERARDDMAAQKEWKQDSRD